MPKEQAPKPDLEHIIAHVETKPEVEGKYLLLREQVNFFLTDLIAAGKATEYNIEQRWICGGENDGVRLRKKISKDGTEKLFITKKNGEKSANGNGYTGEKEIEIKEGDKDLKNFFELNWPLVESSSIKKVRYIFDYILEDDLQTVELDLFEDTELTVAEIEFSGITVDDAILARNKFKSKKFFDTLGLISEKIGFDDRRFKNKSMSKDRTFLHSSFKDTSYYSNLLNKKAKLDKQKEKKDRKEAKKKAKEERKKYKKKK